MKFLSLFSILCWAAQASDISIMLNSQEEESIQMAQDQERNKEHLKSLNSLRLDGIIYTDPSSWTIWLNGRAIKSGEVVETFQIVNVTPDFVELVWSPQPDQHHQICLKPNETFQSTVAVP